MELIGLFLIIGFIGLIGLIELIGLIGLIGLIRLIRAYWIQWINRVILYYRSNQKWNVIGKIKQVK